MFANFRMSLATNSGLSPPISFGERPSRRRRKLWGSSAPGARAGTPCGFLWRKRKQRAQTQVVCWLNLFWHAAVQTSSSSAKMSWSFLYRRRLGGQVQRLPHALHSGHPTLPASVQAGPAAAHRAGTHAGQEAGRLAGLPAVWAWWEPLCFCIVVSCVSIESKIIFFPL